MEDQKALKMKLLQMKIELLEMQMTEGLQMEPEQRKYKCTPEQRQYARDYARARRQLPANTPASEPASEPARDRGWEARNKALKAGYRKSWRETNKAAIAEYTKRWREANPDKVAQYTKRWREANPDKVAQYNKHCADIKKGISRETPAKVVGYQLTYGSKNNPNFQKKEIFATEDLLREFLKDADVILKTVRKVWGT